MQVRSDLLNLKFLSPEAILGFSSFPSAQTMFHAHLRNPQMEERLAEATLQVNPEAWERNRADAERIEGATTVEKLLDLIPIASGMAEPAWHRRMRAVGEEAVPLILPRLKQAKNILDDHLRSLTYEHLLSALRWKGEAGAAALLDCFDVLSLYGKSLACISLGLLGAQQSAPTLWTFYESVKNDEGENYLVGPLWGLIDLQDPRLAEALAELLLEGQYFYELFGFLSLAGDHQVVLPLLILSTVGGKISESVAQHATMALLSIGHRIGRTSLLTEFEKAGALSEEQQQYREAIVNDIMTASPQAAEEYFALFYRDLQPEDIDLDDLRALNRRIEEMERGRLPPQSTQSSLKAKPGRNDPCWCGSSKKYKHCHLRRDREK